MKTKNKTRRAPRVDHHTRELSFGALAHILDGPADEEARELLLLYGVAPSEREDGRWWPLQASVRRLLAQDFTRRRAAVEKAESAAESSLSQAQRERENVLEALAIEERDNLMVAAYLIGIAVGRRLGQQPLAKGGAQ